MSSNPLVRLLLAIALPLIVAVAAGAAVICQVDTGGEYSELPAGPGLTVDEGLNVQQGVYLWEAVKVYGWDFLSLQAAKDVFDVPESLNDHPPLGRYWLGASQQVAKRFFPPAEPERRFIVSSARMGSAVAFALTVWMVGFCAARWYGTFAGLTAAISLVLMPRVFGHAHLAALETFTGLTFTATVLSIASGWAAARRPSFLIAVATGAIFGLLLATKIQAILVPVPLAIWGLVHWRHRAIIPGIVWGLVGGAVFFFLWPWLWLDPIEHVRAYFAQTTGRQTLFVWYLGERFRDIDVPWHYPFVMFAVTVPIGLQLLGIFGLCSTQPALYRDRRAQFVLACIVFPLVVFSLPSVVVYDGVRLFLVVFPLWAIFVGRGAQTLATLLGKWISVPAGYVACLVLIACQGYGLWMMSPSYLPYYNAAVGGTRGAEPLGLEIDYWGTGLTRDLLQEVTQKIPEGATLHVFPVLHGYQISDFEAQSPILRRHGIKLVPFASFQSGESQYVLVFRRMADLQDFNREVLDAGRGKVLAEFSRDGVQLAAVYEVAPSGDRASADDR